MRYAWQPCGHCVRWRVVNRLDHDEDGSPARECFVAGREEQEVLAVEVEVAAIAQARERGVGLRHRAGDRDRRSAVAADGGAGTRGHVDDPVRDLHEGVERKA